MQALHAAAAAHHGQVSAAIAVLALASGDSTVDEAGNLLVTAKHVEARCFPITSLLHFKNAKCVRSLAPLLSDL